MRLAVEVGTVADGTLKGAIQYCKDLEVDRLGVGFTHVPGFEEKGYVELDALKAVRAEIEDAGMSFSVISRRWARWVRTSSRKGERDGSGA